MGRRGMPAALPETHREGSRRQASCSPGSSRRRPAGGRAVSGRKRMGGGGQGGQRRAPRPQQKPLTCRQIPHDSSCAAQVHDATAWYLRGGGRSLSVEWKLHSMLTAPPLFSIPATYLRILTFIAPSRAGRDTRWYGSREKRSEPRGLSSSKLKLGLLLSQKKLWRQRLFRSRVNELQASEALTVFGGRDLNSDHRTEHRRFRCT